MRKRIEVCVDLIAEILQTRQGSANMRAQQTRVRDQSICEGYIMIVNGYKIEPEANLRGANLQGADLRGANIWGADLYRATGIRAFRAGEYNRLCFTYIYNNEQRYQLGCFNGNYEETVKAIRKKYGNDSQYERIVTAYKGGIQYEWTQYE